MKRFILLLFMGFLIAACGLTKEEKNKYQWELEKATSMYEFLFKEGLDKAMSETSAKKLDKSMAYIKYIACINKNQRLRVRFERAKMDCTFETGIKF